MIPRPLGKKHIGEILEVLLWRCRFFYIIITYKPWEYGDSFFIIELVDNSDWPKTKKLSRNFHFWHWYEPLISPWGSGI